MLELGLTQPKVSPLRHYELSGLSVERLMTLLTALDQDVKIDSPEAEVLEAAPPPADPFHLLESGVIR